MGTLSVDYERLTQGLQTAGILIPQQHQHTFQGGLIAVEDSISSQLAKVLECPKPIGCSQLIGGPNISIWTAIPTW